MENVVINGLPLSEYERLKKESAELTEIKELLRREYIDPSSNYYVMIPKGEVAKILGISEEKEAECTTI